jgi:Ca2+-binding RTX toxin-like protein
MGGTGDDVVASRQRFNSGFLADNGVTTQTGADAVVGGSNDGGSGDDLIVVSHDFTGIMQVEGGLDTDTLLWSGDHVFNTNAASQTRVDLEAGTGLNPFGFAVTVSGIENVLGDDRYRDVFRGDNTANILNGFGNNDQLEGRGGADRLEGGAGTDVADYTSSLAVNVDLQAAAQTGNDAQGDVLLSIEQVDGSQFGSDVLRGNSGANYLFGNGGNDTLEGRAGADTLNGGSGSDTASYASSNAAVTITLREPNQTALVSGGHAAGDIYISIEGLLGSSYSDHLTGNSLDNVLNGGFNGQDLLFGLGGNDTLRGGAATDELTGGLGNDKLDGGFEGDFLDGSEGADTVLYGFATRGVFVRLGFNGADGHADADASSLLGNTFEDILRRIENVEGSAFNDELFGNEQANVLSGMNGNDYFVGDLGGDTVSGGNGIDVMDYNLSPQAITIALDGSAGAGGFAAGDRLTLIETVGGSQFNDTITGNATANTLTGFGGFDDLFGGGGNDILDGGADPDDLIGGTGLDTMRGGAGSDTYEVDNAGDIVDESPAGSTGFDTVRSFISFSLDSTNVRGAVERLTLVGVAAINATGNELANRLTGNDAANVLNGLGGADILTGNGGNDTFVLGAESDTVADSSGIDTIRSTITRSLAPLAFIENLVLEGTGNIDGTGNGANNGLTGNSGNNTLVGDAGNDVLSGGSGTDTLDGGADNDTYHLGADFDAVVDASGQDSITSTITRSLAGQVAIENLVLLGATAINGTGNGLANILVGNTNNNALRGGASNDVLQGGIGLDSLVGEGNDDRFRFITTADSAVGPARDVIHDLDDDGNDVIDLSLMAGVSAFIGTAAFSAAGQVRVQQAGANVLVQINTVGNGGAESEILIANATLGAGAGQVDGSDFLV